MSRLKNRIDRLESDCAESLSGDARAMLVQLAARRDALFWPWRSIGSHRSAIKQRQSSYQLGGGIPAKADGRNRWKESHQSRNALIEAGLVTANYSGGQVTDIRPTADGEAIVRRSVSRLRTVAESLPLLARMMGMGRMFLGLCWVSESELFDQTLTGNPEEWSHATEYMLPALVHGLLHSNCDATGRVYYALNLASSVPTEVAVTDRDDTDDSVYTQAFNAERAALESLDQSDGEIVIPIPASGW